MDQCSICLEDITELHVTKCNHKFCKPCIEEWLKNRDSCPYCRTTLQETWVWDGSLRRQYQHSFQLVSQLLNSTFPVGSWTMFDHRATIENLSQHIVAISLRGQTNWVPQAWINFYGRTHRMDLVHLLNSGVRGILFIDGIIPPENIYICPRCRHVTTEEFVSRHIRHPF